MRPNKGLDALHIIGDAVFAILVGADIHADDAAQLCLLQTFQGGRMAFIVEAEAIDDTLILYQTEDTRPGIAGLRLGRDGADFGKAETEPQKRPRYFRILS